MSLPPSEPLPTEGVLAELVAYFEPFSGLRRDFGGTVTLHTPGVNVLALNAAFVGPEYTPPAQTEVVAQLAQWQRDHGTPPLCASVTALPGEDVGGVRVGDFVADPDFRGPIVVEQVSRLHLNLWAGVLAEAHGAPEWAGALARHFAARLEQRPDLGTLLLAYAGGEAIGALLWRPSGTGGAAHLWGTLDPAAAAPLLQAAATLAAGPLRVSLPDTSPLSVSHQAIVTYTRPARPTPDPQG